MSGIYLRDYNGERFIFSNKNGDVIVQEPVFWFHYSNGINSPDMRKGVDIWENAFKTIRFLENPEKKYHE